MTDDMLYIFRNKKLPDHKINFQDIDFDKYGKPI